MKEEALTGGGLSVYVLYREKSAEVILVAETSQPGD